VGEREVQCTPRRKSLSARSFERGDTFKERGAMKKKGWSVNPACLGQRVHERWAWGLLRQKGGKGYGEHGVEKKARTPGGGVNQ